MGVADAPAAVHQEDARRAQREKPFHLQILPRHHRAFVAQDGVGRGVPLDVARNHARAVGHHHQNFGIQGLELSMVMAQLRHMVGAVRSGKANVEHQQRVARHGNGRQGERRAVVVGQGKVGGRAAHG